MIRLTAAAVVLLALGGACGTSVVTVQRSADLTPLRAFTFLEVRPITAPGQDHVPEALLERIGKELARGVDRLALFDRVTYKEEGTSPGPHKVLVLQGVVTRYAEGSRLARALTGGAASLGETTVTLTVHLADKATGTSLAIGRVTGTVTRGVTGGTEDDAIVRLVAGVQQFIWHRF